MEYKVYFYETSQKREPYRVYKYGYTNDLERRNKEHNKDFSTCSPFLLNAYIEVNDKKIAENIETQIRDIVRTNSRMVTDIISGVSSNGNLKFGNEFAALCQAEVDNIVLDIEKKYGENVKIVMPMNN